MGGDRRLKLGNGVEVPYPVPSSAAASLIGRANRRRDTRCELRLRSALHARGLRFRRDMRVPLAHKSVKVDVVLTKARIAVFVDGCFWHGCPEHGSVPRSNVEYWAPKLKRNVERDRAVDAALAAEGWHVERVWEHEDPDLVAERIVTLWSQRRHRRGASLPSRRHGPGGARGA